MHSVFLMSHRKFAKFALAWRQIFIRFLARQNRLHVDVIQFCCTKTLPRSLIRLLKICISLHRFICSFLWRDFAFILCYIKRLHMHKLRSGSVEWIRFAYKKTERERTSKKVTKYHTKRGNYFMLHFKLFHFSSDIPLWLLSAHMKPGILLSNEFVE